MWKYSDITADLTLVYDPTSRFTLNHFPLDFDPEPPDPSCFEVVDAVVAEFGAERYLLGPAGGEAGFVLLGSMERGLLAYADQPELVQRAIQYETRLGNRNDAWYLRPGTDGVLWGTDFASNQGPFVSPGMFRRWCLPSIRERVANVKASGRTVFKHACGNNWKLLDMFIEAGYEVYQSIQASAGMDLGEVKAQYGDRLALWGGVRVENLVSGTPEDVRRDAEAALRVGPPGGGFIFGDTHSIAVGTRYDNFMAMLDTFHRLASA
ncbi:MAG: hypothetical protein EHM21_18160 [Chloroflexi bacterium]|nr:MAG: hypothetical protein EHM21_18160 [Chloroflexota bacterium]